jgi:hypothetical protein
MDVGTDNTGYSGLLGRYILQLKWNNILNVFVANIIKTKYGRIKIKVRENRRSNQERTKQSRKDNSETLAILGTQDTEQRLEKTKGAIKNGQSRDTLDCPFSFL